MRAIGYVSLAVGVMWLLYVFNLDTSVPIGLTGQRVQNLSLMEQRQTHLVLAIATVLVGVLLLVAAGLRDGRVADDIEPVEDEDYAPCPHCAEPIRVSAVLCRHCRSAVEAMPIDLDSNEVVTDLEPDPDATGEGTYKDLARAVEEAERRTRTS